MGPVVQKLTEEVKDNNSDAVAEAITKLGTFRAGLRAGATNELELFVANL